MPEPKCPLSINVAIGDNGEPFVLNVSTPAEAKNQGYNVVEYIPRHVADQQSREAVRLAIEAERAARHREDSE